VLCSALVGRDAKKQRDEKLPPTRNIALRTRGRTPKAADYPSQFFCSQPQPFNPKKKRWENKMRGTTAGVHRWGRGETGRDLACFLGQLLRGFLSAQIFTPLALPWPVQQSRGQGGEGFFSFGCGE